MALTNMGIKSSYSKNIYLEKDYAGMVKCILGNYFIGQDTYQDQTQGTDFLTFTMRPFKIGVRLRRKCENFDRYKHEFSIRWELPSGVETEIHKIRKNFVQYILYGFVDESEKKIIRYFIGDLKVFNAHSPAIIPRIFQNNPRDSDFAVYKIADFPENFILKHYEK